MHVALRTVRVLWYRACAAAPAAEHHSTHPATRLCEEDADESQSGIQLLEEPASDDSCDSCDSNLSNRLSPRTLRCLSWSVVGEPSAHVVGDGGDTRSWIFS